MSTRKLSINALLAAMCAVLGAISIDLGNLKLTFESLPVLLSALMFGPVDAMFVGGIGTLLYQLLHYGLTLTTALWILPYVLCGLFAGLYAKKHGFALDRRRLALCVFLSGLMIFFLNTGVLYIDSKIYGYYNPVYIFGSMLSRVVICLLKAAAFTAVLPKLIEAARRGLGD